MVCNHCKKTYHNGIKFCPQCGTELNETMDKEVKSQNSAMAGMFAIGFVPIAGFLAASIWAWAKFKNMKFKFVSLVAAFMVLNIFTTVLSYALVVSSMKNDLVNAAKEQGLPVSEFLEQADVLNTKPETGAQLPVNIPGMGAVTIDPSAVVPDFSEAVPLPENHDTTAEPNPEPAYDPEDFNLPKTDEDGNMYFDSNGDGKYDYYMDEDFNMHIDQDGDGEYETIYEQEFSDGALD